MDSCFKEKKRELIQFVFLDHITNEGCGLFDLKYLNRRDLHFGIRQDHNVDLSALDVVAVVADYPG